MSSDEESANGELSARGAFDTMLQMLKNEAGELSVISTPLAAPFPNNFLGATHTLPGGSSLF